MPSTDCARLIITRLTKASDGKVKTIGSGNRDIKDTKADAISKFPVPPVDYRSCKTKNPEKIGARVVMEGIEPPTQGFSVLCSTN